VVGGNRPAEELEPLLVTQLGTCRKEGHLEGQTQLEIPRRFLNKNQLKNNQIKRFHSRFPNLFGIKGPPHS
jgi:hypothetical protein